MGREIERGNQICGKFLPKVQKCQTRRGAAGGIRFLETHGGTRGWNLDIGCVAAAMREVSSQPSEG